MIEVERVKHMSVEEAIEALEQQPCEDAVSRQAVHGLIAELLSDYLHDEDREKIEELDVKIEGLPSVTPKEKTATRVSIDAEPSDAEFMCRVMSKTINKSTDDRNFIVRC